MPACSLPAPHTGQHHPMARGTPVVASQVQGDAVALRLPPTELTTLPREADLLRPTGLHGPSRRETPSDRTALLFLNCPDLHPSHVTGHPVA